MPRILKWIAAVFALLAVAVVAAIFLFDWNMLRGPIEARVEAATGRDFAIEGDLQGEFSWQPWMRARDIRLANADWAQAEELVHVEELALRIDARELLRGQLVIMDTRIRGADIQLEIDEEGRANWDMAGDAGDAADGGDSQRSEVPLLEKLVVEDSRLTLEDASRDIQLEAQVASAEVVSPEEGSLPVSLEGEGRVQGHPFSIAASGGSLALLRQEEEPYPIEIEIAVGQTRARAEGTLTAPLQLAGMDGELWISGPTPDELAPILNIPLPSTPPYELSGRLRRDDQAWYFEDFNGTVGESDLAGDMRVEVDQEKPLIVADLISERLAFEDLGTLVGLPPEPEQVTEQSEAGGRVRLLPDAPLQIEQVRSSDAQVSFRGEQVIAPGLPLDNVALDLVIDEGVLQLQPVVFDFAGGQLSLFLSLYATVDPVETDYDLRLSGIQLQRIFNQAGLEGEAQGVIEGRTRFSTVGNTVRSAFATAEGDAAFLMDGGLVSGSILQLLDAGFLEAIAVVLSDGVPADMNIRCLIGAFDIQDGVLTSNPVLLDTEDSAIQAEGIIDLGEEALDLEIGGEAKDPGFASSRLAVTVGGTFAEPAFGVDPTELAIRGGLAAALGTLVTPLAALLPFLELGLAEDAPCAALMGSAEAEVEADE
ncbi:AsmA family protein [Aquibaculum arenosum]|uniref:AsmA family protein n=1 Tax=Aquibaculum arenosum TaxID=3032591 RepID=A0ABT5YKA1_9PROT|nr:AsmA family protein [Fodinicurvata sp. CAU 1616]MDF2095372.1 AsmA family protein [Fodinicurvata sp. CAU 1616]